MAIKEPGKFIELGIEQIGEGKFKQIFQQKLREIHKALMDYEEQTKDQTGSASMTAKITLSRTKGMQEFATIQFSFTTKTPQTAMAATNNQTMSTQG